LLLKGFCVQILICRGDAGETRASGGKPFEKGLSENFQLG
jgi:hypothetical protein